MFTIHKNTLSTGIIKRFSMLLFLTLFTLESTAAAFCALRDPTDSISSLFPEYNSTRSFVKNISLEAKQRLQEHLPFEFHYKEFGKHTLYLVFNDDEPIGLIHARPEKGQWGINEIVWALDMDFNIIGFRFQRCRCMNKDEVESNEFREFLYGQNWQSLSEALVVEDNQVDGLPENISDEGRLLARTLIRSAIKASLTTSLVWGKELYSLQRVSPTSNAAK